MGLIRHNPKRDANEVGIVTVLRQAGCLVWHLSEKGLPDLLVGYRKRFVLFEVKTPRGQLTTAQKRFINQAHFARLPVWVVSDPDQALECLELEKV